MSLALLALLLVAEGSIEPPVLEHFVAAEYPAGAAAEKRAGAVLLSLEIDAEGHVTAVVVVESAGADLDAAASEAARHFVFRPALLDGEPIPVRILYRYTFTLDAIVPSAPVLNFTGVVIERWKKTPLPNVRISLPALGTSTISDAAGRFAFAGVPEGQQIVRAEGAGLVAITTEVEIKPRVRVELRLSMEPAPDGEAVDEEEVVRAPRVRKEIVETRIEAREAKMVPGTQGDTVKVVQSLPGVGRTAVGSGALVVWGAAPGDTRTYVDGVLIPRLFHSGGVRATLASELVKSVDLVPAGYGPEYGRALGGLVRVETAVPAEDGLHAHASADVLDAAAGVRGTLAGGLTNAAGARKSILDQTFGRAVDDRSRALVPIPDYWDYQEKLSWGLAPGERLDLLVFGSDDRLERRTPSPDPSRLRAETTESTYHRAALRYERVLGDGASISVLPWVGWERSRLGSTFGDVPAGLSVDTLRAALRASERRKLAGWGTLRTGLDLEANHSVLDRSGSLTLPSREGDITTFGLPPGDRVNADRWTVNVAGAAAWAGLELDLFGADVQIQPGLRIEGILVDGDRVVPVRGTEPAVGYSRLSFVADPRLQAAWRVLSWLSINGAVGLYHQPPDPADLSPVFGNPALGVASAIHALAGAAFKLSDRAQLEITGFQVILSDLPTRSAQPTPPVARSLVSEGTGRNSGAQLVLRGKLGDTVSGWVSYALMRAERQDHPGGPTRLFDADQTHALSAVASWAIGSGFELGARFRYASGFPRTAVVGAFYNARTGGYEPIYGPQNATRLPDFLQLDLRVAWSSRVGGIDLSVFLDIENVTNRQNPEEIVYRSDFSDRGYISGLPFLPVLGVRGEL